MTKQTPSSLLLVGAIAGGAGFVAFVALMVVGDFTVSPAGFLALLVALATAIVLFQGLHRDRDATDRPARAPVAGDRTFGTSTVKAGTAGVRPGSAGVDMGTASAAAAEPVGATNFDGTSTAKPSSAAIAPGPEHAADVAGHAPSSALGGMPETSALNGTGDAAAHAERHGSDREEAQVRDVREHPGHGGGAAGQDPHAGAAQTHAGAGDVLPVVDQSASPKVRSGTLLAGEEDLAARKGAWRYERGDAGAGSEPAPRGETAGGSTRIGVEPSHLSEAREGGADDLKRIKGVGPKLEEMLHRMGFFHYDQIAAWSDKEALWVDEHLEGFKGRVERDGWVDQARRLAAGEEIEFSQRADEDSATS